MISLTEEYQAAVEDSSHEDLDHAKYIKEFDAIKAEGESRHLDIFEDWHE